MKKACLWIIALSVVYLCAILEAGITVGPTAPGGGGGGGGSNPTGTGTNLTGVLLLAGQGGTNQTVSQIPFFNTSIYPKSVVVSNSPIWQVVDVNAVVPPAHPPDNLIYLQNLNSYSSGHGFTWTRSGTNRIDPVLGTVMTPANDLIDVRTGLPSINADGSTNYAYVLEAASIIEVPAQSSYGDSSNYFMVVVNPGELFRWAEANGNGPNRAYFQRGTSSGILDLPLWQGNQSNVYPTDAGYLQAFTMNQNTGVGSTYSNFTVGGVLTVTGNINATFTPLGAACNINADGNLAMGNNDTTFLSSGHLLTVSNSTGGIDCTIQQAGYTQGSSGGGFFFQADKDGDVGKFSAAARAVYAYNLIQRGGLGQPEKGVNVAYTLTTNDCFLTVDTTAADVIVTLPAANLTNLYDFKVKMVKGTHNVIVTNANGSDTIDGALSNTNGTLYKALEFHADGTNWFVW